MLFFYILFSIADPEKMPRSNKKKSAQKTPFQNPPGRPPPKPPPLNPSSTSEIAILLENEKTIMIRRAISSGKKHGIKFHKWFATLFIAGLAIYNLCATKKRFYYYIFM